MFSPKTNLIRETLQLLNIDTGDAAHIKQRLRRTPACYVGEEEKHLRRYRTFNI